MNKADDYPLGVHTPGECTKTVADCFFFNQERQVFLNDTPLNLYEGGAMRMISYMELFTLLSVITAVISLVVMICNGNKKN